MIEVKNLTKNYGGLKAVDDISFRVNSGEILGFLGPNGAGKTTTMRILTCFTPATSGTAQVAGFDVFKQSMEVRKRIGYLPENPPLYDDMTVKSFLRFVADIKGVPPSMKKSKTEAAVEMCGLEKVHGRVIGNLSKGFRQRTALAQALIHDPPVLILDEPTVGLDPKQIIEIRRLIKKLGGERTIILSTHILPEVTMTCERVVIINNGGIVAEDSYRALSRGLSKNERIYVELDDIPGPDRVAEAFRGLDGVIEVYPEIGGFTVETKRDSGVRKELAPFIVGRNWTLTEMRRVELSLEDVFVELTTEEELEE